MTPGNRHSVAELGLVSVCIQGPFKLPQRQSRTSREDRGSRWSWDISAHVCMQGNYSATVLVGKWGGK
jgi:hypothetical protein